MTCVVTFDRPEPGKPDPLSKITVMLACSDDAWMTMFEGAYEAVRTAVRRSLDMVYGSMKQSWGRLVRRRELDLKPGQIVAKSTIACVIVNMASNILDASLSRVTGRWQQMGCGCLTGLV